jgi:hypothetical protein
MVVLAARHWHSHHRRSCFAFRLNSIEMIFNCLSKQYCAGYVFGAISLSEKVFECCIVYVLCFIAKYYDRSYF